MSMGPFRACLSNANVILNLSINYIATKIVTVLQIQIRASIPMEYLSKIAFKMGKQNTYVEIPFASSQNSISLAPCGLIASYIFIGGSQKHLLHWQLIMQTY